MIGTIPAIRAEWIELTTLRTTAALLSVTAAIGLAISWAVAVFVTDEVLLVSEVVVYSTVLTALLASIGGILAITAEIHHGTLPTALMIHPSRWPVVAATTIAAAVLGVTLGAVGLVSSYAGAVIGGLEIGPTRQLAANCGWALTFTAAAALLGVGIGMAVQHSAAAISGLLAWWLVFENLLLVFLPDHVARFLPYVAGGGLLDIGSAWEFDSLSRPQNALVFATYTAVALAIGAICLRHRDLH